VNILILVAMGASLAGLVLLVYADGKARWERTQEQVRWARMQAELTAWHEENERRRSEREAS
jgi:hypothetical protein